MEEEQQLVTLPTGSDVYSFLAGTQPVSSSGPQVPTGVPIGVQDNGSRQPFLPHLPIGCQAPSLPPVVEAVPVPLSAVAPAASPVAPTAAELGMILRAIQTFLTGTLPKLELGDVAAGKVQ